MGNLCLYIDEFSIRFGLWCTWQRWCDSLKVVPYAVSNTCKFKYQQRCL